MNNRMARDHRPAEELSIEELEALLARRKLAAREARLRRFQRSGRALPLAAAPATSAQISGATAEGEAADEATRASRRPEPKQGRTFLNRLLLVVEAGAVVGLVAVFLSGFSVLQQLNQEVTDSLAPATAQPTPLITAVVLPSGHKPPTSPGGARPNDDEIPPNLRPLVQSLPIPEIPTPGPEHARTIFIPVLWSTPAPVVLGDGWEQLKKGVGQHVGTGNPGEGGNMVLSAHNDIFGELFRYLDRLKPGDEIIISTSSREYVYRVTGVRIVEPTEVSVMASTARSTVTLISCYPYLVDNQRIIVSGELSTNE